VRFFNTVGPRQTGQYGMVLPSFVQQALAGQPITVFGDGTQQRSFTYIGDVVGCLLKLVKEPKAIGQVFQHRQRRGSVHPEAGGARERTNEEQIRDCFRAVRQGV
jgi:nucleoside-diphosphate-sugar epimerase